MTVHEMNAWQQRSTNQRFLLRYCGLSIVHASNKSHDEEVKRRYRFCFLFIFSTFSHVYSSVKIR